MPSEFDNYYRARVESSLIRKRAEELDLTTDYEVAIDTTVKEYGDVRGVKYGLSAETTSF